MQDFLFEQFKTSISNLDPVSFVEANLRLDGKPFCINGNGYKPFADIYRYIGITALNDGAKPVVLVKGRQVGATTMAASLAMFFMCSGLFGTNGRPPARVLHCFPTLVHVFDYAKTKLKSAIYQSRLIDHPVKPGKQIAFAESFLDRTAASGNSLQFKQFINGNYLRVESTGPDADRLRGGTVDMMFYDECFPYEQHIQIKNGKIKIGELYDMFVAGADLPEVLTYNEKLDIFEYKKILHAWKRDKKPLTQIICANRKIKCTDNHRFLTEAGWKQVKELNVGDLIKSASSDFKEYELTPVKSTVNTKEVVHVYDIEVEDNHNFIVTSGKTCKNLGGLIAHNCQDIFREAIANANKLLNKSQYGSPGNGVQVYFGTPKQRGGHYWDMWQMSNQQYFHLGCEGCSKLFPLYTPGSDEWRKIWIHGWTVKCPHCGCEQDKRPAAERGKWVPLIPTDDCRYVGYHINQLFMPDFNLDRILAERPEVNPNMTERGYQNEVLGEFYRGAGQPITVEEIKDRCADKRSMSSGISISDERKVYAGFDWGGKDFVDDGKRRPQGQSYSCGVVLAEEGPNLLSIEFATVLRRNDLETKRDIVNEIFRRYSVRLGVGDIGYANELSELLHRDHGDKFLASQASARVNGYIKFHADFVPKTIIFERDYHVAEMFDLMKRGMIRFPFEDYEQIYWLVQHCASMEIKTTANVYGDSINRFVKGTTPNDGFMALLNAYLAYKFDITGGFSNKMAGLMDKRGKRTVHAVLGYIPRM